MHTLQKPTLPTNRREIFRINVRINSTAPSIDATKTLDNNPALRNSIMARLSPRPHLSILPSLVVVTNPPRVPLVEHGHHEETPTSFDPGKI
jgi:hypothetical protein